MFTTASLRSLGIISSLKLNLKLTIETSSLTLIEIFSFRKVCFDIMCIYDIWPYMCISRCIWQFLQILLLWLWLQKNWLPSHIHFPFSCCMAVRSNTSIHFAGSQFLCGNARHHLRIVFSVMLSVLICLSYTMGFGLGQSWAFSFMIGKLPHTHIISEYHRFILI